MLIGNIKKMGAKLQDPVEYQFLVKTDPLKENVESLYLNDLLGKKITLKFAGEINCVHCGKITKKSFSGGYCFPCSKRLAQCDICILKPELCHYHKGTCREPEWGEKNCMIPHIVYLSNSSGLKVGITRETQVPTRWIDQGALAAIPIFRVSTRLQSGVFEKFLAEDISDKTNWRKMLKNDVPELDLESERDFIFEKYGEGLDDLEERFGEDQISFLEDEQVTNIQYPVLEYPEKITSLSFDKNKEIEGTLIGIKGQYLILDNGVINIRRHSGYKVSLIGA
jgi:hypothetical protein